MNQQLAQSGATSVVDIFSKFGEDGTSSTIAARNLYLQGLVNLAQGDKAEARKNFARSLEINPSNVWAKYFQTQAK